MTISILFFFIILTNLKIYKNITASVL